MIAVIFRNDLRHWLILLNIVAVIVLILYVGRAVLSPKCSSGQPSLFSMASSRFDMGVSCFCSRCRLPSSVPPAWPASTMGSGSWLCELPSLMPLPYSTSE